MTRQKTTPPSTKTWEQNKPITMESQAPHSYHTDAEKTHRCQ